MVFGALRKARGLTLAEIALRLSRSVGWVSQVERGLSTPSLSDLRAFADLFASDAVVHDEGHEHHGPAAIRSWIEEAHLKYQPLFEPNSYREEDGGAVCVITGMVSGNFDGSPIELKHRLEIVEGKITLPVLLSFRRGSESDREFWNRTLTQGEIKDGDLDHAIALMTRHRAIEDTIGRAHHYGNMAKDALALIPACEMKLALEETVDFCISRTH